MNKYLAAIAAMLTSLLSAAAHAAPGEYWEITSKTEMPGMPFAMPAMTQKVCIPKGGQSDPGKTSGDKECKMTDIKTVGNKTTWKARCDHDGEVMTGVGEQTTTANSYQGKLKLSGKSGGENVNMTMAYSGKRIGGSCDSEETVKKVQKEQQKMTAQACDKLRNDTTAKQIGSADLILQPRGLCADQRKRFCDLVRKDAPRDAEAYNAVLMHDQQMGGNISVAKECKLNMAATTKAICKTLNGRNYRQLSAHCPAQAKAYREAERRKECEGRSYTAETRAEDIKRCLSDTSDTSDYGTSSEDSSPQESGNSGGSSPATEVLEGAKKLKGLFGF